MSSGAEMLLGPMMGAGAHAGTSQLGHLGLGGQLGRTAPPIAPVAARVAAAWPHLLRPPLWSPQQLALAQAVVM
jgi:hypothetical protein